jgi:hypothetical protein
MRSLVLPFLRSGAGGVPLDELAGVDEEAWRPRRTTADIALGSSTRHDLIIYK